MNLFRITELRDRHDSYSDGQGGTFYVGRVYPEERVRRYYYVTGTESAGETPDDGLPETLPQVVSFCQHWIDFALGPVVADLGDAPGIFRPVIHGLREAVSAMPEAPAPPEQRSVNYLSRNVGQAVANELKRYRDWAAQATATPKVENGGQSTVGQHVEQIVQVVGDENATRILAIAQRKDWEGERRMEEILRVDNRFGGKDSAKWGKLLGVSAAAVRGYSLWKRLQQAKKADT